MILIAESGATKTDWRYIDRKGVISQARTLGLNPYQQSAEAIINEITSKLLIEIKPQSVKEVYFYGAGCATTEGRNRISKSLNKVFPGAASEVNSDILAAARGLCGKEPGIACILGTGINSCLYDGEKIVESVPPLGFIIADEGSGAHLGKILVSDYWRKDMPEKLRRKFTERYKLDRATLLDKVYNQDKPGRFLAEFTRFISENLPDPYLYQLVYHAFEVFFEKNIRKYVNYQSCKVHFTGGVAFHFNEILREVAKKEGVTIRKIVENPIAGLTLYHQPA